MSALSTINLCGDVFMPINGNLTKPQADKMRVCLHHLENIEKHITNIERVVLGLIQPYLPQIEILLSLPSIKYVFTAIAIIGEIGYDMAVFICVQAD
jgi:transposase